MKPVSRVMAVLLLLGVAFAQNIPVMPKNPLNYLLRSLQTEAGLNFKGVVTETVTFPPRKETDQTKENLPAPPPINPNLLRQNFSSSLENGEQIAGRSTWKITLTPNNHDAASFQFWIDREWNVRLAHQETDFNNTVTSRARFTSLNGKPTLRKDGRTLGKLEFKPKLEAFLAKTVGDIALPEGFRIFGLRVRTVGQDNQAALEVRASNGLSVMVIVFSPIKTRATPKLATRKLLTKNGDAWVWVIGNLPEAQLQRTANSVVNPLDLTVLLVKFNEQNPK
jgi:negative regulator of sigma E activity